MAKIILMQDNSKNILADKGWEAMEQILDKEMPQKKKRRFFIWWFFGGLLVLSAYLVIQYSFGDQRKPVAMADKTVLSEATVNKEKKDSEDITVIEEDEESLNISTNEDHQNSKEVLESTHKIEKVKKTETLTSSEVKENLISRPFVKKAMIDQPIQTNRELSKIDAEPILKTTNNVNNRQSTVVVIDKSIEDTNSTKENETIDVDQNSTIEENVDLNFQNNSQKDIASERDKSNTYNKTEQLENLVDISIKRIIEDPLKERLILAFAKLQPVYIFEEKIADIIVTEVEPQSYWYGNIGAYLNWGPNVKLYGLDAQADVGYSLNGLVDLGLSMGLGSFRYAASTNEASAITAVGRTMISSNEAANVLNSSFSNASYLDLGLHAGWNISKNLKVRADAGYTYLFTAMFENTSETFGNGLDMQGTAGAPELDAQDIDVEGTKGSFSEFTYELDKKWFPYAGINLQTGLTNKLSVDLGYRKVFGDLFPSSSNPLSMDRIRLGIKYRFLYRPNKQ